MFKDIIKVVYTYVFNGSKILSFSSFGKGSFIGRRFTLHKTPSTAIVFGDKVRFGSDLRVSCYETGDNDVSPEVTIENGVYAGTNISILTASKVWIKQDALLASYIHILGENHSIDPELQVRYGNQPLTSFPVVIGKGCWIGQNVTILSKPGGISIGDKSVIGAGSVVTKDIPPYCIAVGNPAKVIKKYSFTTHKWESCTKEPFE